MRVIHTIASLDPRHGGPSRSVPALVAALRQAGVDARSHAWDHGSLDATIDEAGMPQIIHDHGIWLPVNHRTAAFARRRAVPFVVSVRGMLEPWARAYRGWKKRVAWLLFQRRDLASASAIHVTSESEAQAIRAAGLLNPLILIPNGIEVPSSLPSRPLDPPRHRALFLSRIHPKKGLRMLIQSWADVRPPDWELVIAGPAEGGYRAELEHFVSEARLEDAIHFLGAVSDQAKWALYRSADLFVLPTYSENFGLVVGEALAAEVPVLTTTAAPWRELHTHKCGWWIEPTFDATVAALREATSLTDEHRHAMGLRGRHLILERYGWPEVGRRMAAAYGWLLGGGEPPDSIHA